MRQNPDNKEKKLAKKNTAVSQNQGLSMENESGQIIASLKDQLKLQKLISEISAKFVNLAASKVDSEINNGLKIILEYMNLDRCTLAELSKDKKDLLVTHSYYKPGFEPITNSNVMDSFPWLGENLIQGNIVAITKPLDFPSIANEEREYCQQKGLKSILAIPVSVGGSLMCTLAFITFRNYQNWPKYAIEQLTLIVEVFANAIFRKRSDEQQRLHVENLAKQVQFEQLISSLSARFINVQTKQVGQKIEESLRQLAEYIGVDRSTFFRISKEQNKLIPVHTYVVEGVETLGEIPFMSWFPWAAKK